MQIQPKNFTQDFPCPDRIIFASALARTRISPKVEQKKNRIKYSEQQREFTKFVGMNFCDAETRRPSENSQFLRADEKYMAKVITVFFLVQKPDGAGFVDG